MNDSKDSPKLLMEEVDVSYDESLILRKMGLKVPDNAVVALLGRNGVGKTTVLRTIMGVARASDGDLRFDGKSIQSMSTEGRSRLGIGYVPRPRDLSWSDGVGESQSESECPRKACRQGTARRSV